MSAKKQSVKPEPVLVQPEFILGVAGVMTFGVDKHGEYDYLDSHSLSEYYNKAMRHLLAFWSGQDNDPETGLSHLFHAAANLNIMFHLLNKHPDRDDRDTT